MSSTTSKPTITQLHEAWGKLPRWERLAEIERKIDELASAGNNQDELKTWRGIAAMLTLLRQCNAPLVEHGCFAKVSDDCLLRFIMAADELHDFAEVLRDWANDALQDAHHFERNRGLLHRERMPWESEESGSLET